MKSVVLSWLALAASVAAGSSFVADGGIEYTVTTFKDGVEIDSSDPFSPRPFRSHPLDTDSAVPPIRSAKARRSDSITYSANWCGMGLHTSSSHGFLSVTGYLSVPSPSIRPANTTPQSIAAWMGIDGASWKTALLQVGVTTQIQANGSTSSWAWFEWAPQASNVINGFPVAPNDWIFINVTALTNTTASIFIRNDNQGVSTEIRSASGPALGRLDAEWIVEDFKVNGELVAFPRFQDIWFEETGATTIKGASLDLDGASLIYLGPDNSTAQCVPNPYDSSNFHAASQN